MKNTAVKAISYRRCVISPKPQETLQQMLASSLVKHAKPGDRWEPLNAASSELRVIGKTVIKGHCLCGYLSSFERGASQAVITDDATAATLALGSVAPPTPAKGAKQQQFIPGVLYFAVYENHLVTVQSSSIRTKALEAHLNWLLKSKTTTLPATSSFALSDEAQKATKTKIKKSHVKSIAFGQPLMSEVEEPSAAAAASAQSTVALKGKKPPSRFQPSGPILEYLRNHFNDGNGFEKLGLDGVFDGNLEVWIEIRYPKFKRDKSEDTVKLMDTLGMALRDIDEDQVALTLTNGHKVSGKELKISGTVETEMLTNGLPDETDLFNEMTSWLKAQIVNGVVDP